MYGRQHGEALRGGGRDLYGDAPGAVRVSGERGNPFPGESDRSQRGFPDQRCVRNMRNGTGSNINPPSLSRKRYMVSARSTGRISKKRAISECCYPTCSTISIYPLLKEDMIDPSTIIIDAKSGTSGAGRGAKTDNLFCEVNENIKAYGVASHRHTPEIEDQLGYACGQEVLINFTPHLIPMNRGILITAYASLKKDVSYEEVKAAYDKYYEKEQFVRVLDKDVCPQTKWVEGSNYVDVNFKIDPRTKRIIMMGAMDNLVKGAAGQAVQNMNLLFGFDEAEGLRQIPMVP